jgi:Zn-finger nucleic acid-binding protein
MALMVYRRGPTPAGSCPRCAEALLPIADVAGVKWCERCGGVLADVAASNRIVTKLDRALLEIGFQAARGKPKKPDGGRNITCPECLMEMQRVLVASAACIVDACTMHGTWFDTGELEDVMRAYSRARRAGVFVQTTMLVRSLVEEGQ